MVLADKITIELKVSSLFFASRGHILHLGEEMHSAAVKFNTNLSMMMVHPICEVGYAIHRSHS